MSDKADFLGAVRLPSTAFKKIANTEAISDIIFLQKKGKEEKKEKEDWLFSYDLKDGIRMNNYFFDKPYMIKGEIEYKSGPYGKTLNIKPTGDLKQQLNDTLEMLPSNVVDLDELGQIYVEEMGESIPVG